MSKPNYDGWTLKSKCLHLSFCHYTRKEVIDHVETVIREPWTKYRLRGTHKIVKIKLMEVK